MYLKCPSVFRFLLLLGFAMRVTLSGAQTGSPVVWSTEAKHLHQNEFAVVIHASLKPGWHLYSAQQGKGGPPATQVILEHNKNLLLRGTLEEQGDKFDYYDTSFGMNIRQYSGSVSFVQRILAFSEEVEVKGRVEFVACNSELCLPDEKKFTIHIKQHRE